jgi:hypothetical protein
VQGRVQAGEVGEAGGEAAERDDVRGCRVPANHLRRAESGLRGDGPQVGAVVANADLHDVWRPEVRRRVRRRRREAVADPREAGDGRVEHDKGGAGPGDDLDHAGKFRGGGAQGGYRFRVVDLGEHGALAVAVRPHRPETGRTPAGPGRRGAVNRPVTTRRRRR